MNANEPEPTAAEATLVTVHDALSDREAAHGPNARATDVERSMAVAALTGLLPEYPEGRSLLRAAIRRAAKGRRLTTVLDALDYGRELTGL